MNNVDCALHKVSGGCLRSITFADLASEFCKLPRHEEMSNAFIAHRGRYDREQFLMDFNAPSWAYDFLCAMIRDVRVQLNAMRIAKDDGYALI